MFIRNYPYVNDVCILLLSSVVNIKNTITPIITEKSPEYNTNNGKYTELIPVFLFTSIIHIGLLKRKIIAHRKNDTIIDKIHICVEFFMSIFIYIKQ